MNEAKKIEKLLAASLRFRKNPKREAPTVTLVKEGPFYICRYNVAAQPMTAPTRLGMNEAKKIKKFLRNKDNKVIVKIVETDCWGGDDVLTSTTTYGNLEREALSWEQEFKQKYGTPPGLVMDAPYLIYLLTIENKEGEQLYKKIFWKKEEVRDFLIGGFDGVLRNE